MRLLFVTRSTALRAAFKEGAESTAQVLELVERQSLHLCRGVEGWIYLLLPSVPPDKPPILPKSMKGTAPPETWGKVPFHFSTLLYWTKIGLIDRDRASLALAGLNRLGSALNSKHFIMPSFFYLGPLLRNSDKGVLPG